MSKEYGIKVINNPATSEVFFGDKESRDKHFVRWQNAGHDVEKIERTQ